MFSRETSTRHYQQRRQCYCKNNTTLALPSTLTPHAAWLKPPTTTSPTTTAFHILYFYFSSQSFQTMSPTNHLLDRIAGMGGGLFSRETLFRIHHRNKADIQKPELNPIPAFSREYHPHHAQAMALASHPFLPCANIQPITAYAVDTLLPKLYNCSVLLVHVSRENI